jgi:hypothetical protein
MRTGKNPKGKEKRPTKSARRAPPTNPMARRNGSQFPIHQLLSSTLLYRIQRELGEVEEAEVVVELRVVEDPQG